LTGTGPDLAREESAGRVYGVLWNRTDPFLRSQPGPLAGYPDPLQLLLVCTVRDIKHHDVVTSRILVDQVCDKTPGEWKKEALITSDEAMEAHICRANSQISLLQTAINFL